MPHGARTSATMPVNCSWSPLRAPEPQADMLSPTHTSCCAGAAGAAVCCLQVMVAAVSTVSCFCTTSLPVSSCNISLAMLQVGGWAHRVEPGVPDLSLSPTRLAA